MQEINITLEALIPQYVSNKQELDDYKKLCDNENKKIKEIMAEHGYKEYEAAGYRATYSVAKKESMNEDKLLEIAHTYGILEIVKTREYIDFDALEKAIYDGKISEDILLEMDKAKDVKEVVTLRIYKAKEKK